MRKHLLLLSLLAPLTLAAQEEVIKIDFDQSGRQTSEVTEPNYTAWPIKGVNSATQTFGNVTVTITAADGGTLTCGWSKALIQSPYYARLVNDGVTTEAAGGSIEVRLSGLSAGLHSIQTYNNSWENGSAFEMSPIDVLVDGDTIHRAVAPSVRVESNADATRLYTEVSVAHAGDDVVLRFSPVDHFVVSDASKTALCKVFLDALEIGLPDASRQASRPMPEDNDMHADCDGGIACLSWCPVAGTTTQHLYFGTDSLTVASYAPGDPAAAAAVLTASDSSFQVPDVHNLHVYWWRVDQTDAQGVVTRGLTWNFRPRHLAFRTAEGYGKYAIGGRGGKVVYVTNLNDSGEGSFREALTHDIGPRTIVFAVSGIIRLNSRLTCSDKYVTVAGQTAPGKGICFRAAPLGVGSDGVWRFVRMRLGGGPTYDGIGAAGANHSILDHCSISWTIDESFSSRGAKNITLQRTLISEALNVAGHQNYEYGKAHGFAGSVGGDVASLHHNLLAHNEGRNWSMAGGLDGAGYYAGRLDIFNMVVYNWGGRTTDGGAHEVNFVGNYYKKGPACRRTTLLNAQLEGTGLGSQSYYYHNNIMTEANGKMVYNGANDTQGRTYTLSGGQILDWPVFVDEPFFPSLAKVESAQDAYKSVLSDVGCNQPVLDDHDTRVLGEVKAGTTTYKGSYTSYPGLPDNEQDVGGYEDYPEETRAADFDSDYDGLPDWWEQLYGTDPHSAAGDFSDANADPDADGYTRLDDYLEWMSRPHYYIYKDAPAVVDLSCLTGNYKTPIAYTVEVDPHLIATVSGSTATFTMADADYQGVAFVTVTGTDADGSVATGYLAVAAMGSTSSLTAVSNSRLAWTAAGILSGDVLTLRQQNAPAGNATIVVRDASGKVIATQDCMFDTTSAHSMTMTIPVVGRGLYLVEVCCAHGARRCKVVSR